eukprot:g10085.t2
MMHGNRSSPSAPTYLESSRPFHSDDNRPRSSSLDGGGQDPKVRLARSFVSGAEECTQGPLDTAGRLGAPAPAPSHGREQDADARPTQIPAAGSTLPHFISLAGTTRPRFCSRHKEQGHVCLKNRPCLFQGCDTRPQDGLPGGRGVFCAAHKEGIIHVLNETNNATRKRCEARAAKVEGRATRHPTHEEEEGGEWEERHEKQRSGKGLARRGKRSAAEDGPVVSNRGYHANKRRTTAAGACSRTKGLSSAFRAADASGLAPSDEMRLLLEARQSTRVAGEASNSGRRSRVPSRKFLEASGRESDEGAQWMTKEKREEQARKKRELKEQKKAAAAAGLRVGQVLETAALRLPRGASCGGAAWGGGGRVVSKVVWRKLTPAELLRVVGKQSAIDGAQLDNAKAADTTNAIPVSKKKQEESASTSAAAASEIGTVPEEQKKYVAGAGGPAALQGSTVAEMAHESWPKRRRQDLDEGAGGGGKRAAKATCEFENCPKKASFGVNGVVRYCKMHRIFGMHVIDDCA